jgi:glycosyltransferase involved in cell wall biosynthesis
MPVFTHVPCVVTVHDLGHRVHPAGHTWSQVRYLEWTTRRHVRLASALVADSESTRADLVRLYAVHPDRVFVAPLGVGKAFRPADATGVALARDALLVEPGRRYFIHIGTNQPRKNLERLVAAFGRIAGLHPDVDLVLAGRDGWGHSDPLGAARRAGIERRVRRVGYLPREHLAGAYSGALATVVPSLYEGFGLTALEAMACGSPVIAAQASSLPEVVGDAGILVDPLDVGDLALAMGLVAADQALAGRLSAAGRERAGAFTWSRCADRVEDAIASALGSAGPDAFRTVDASGD